MTQREHIFRPGALLDPSGRNLVERAEADIRELMNLGSTHRELAAHRAGMFDRAAPFINGGMDVRAEASPV